MYKVLTVDDEPWICEGIRRTICEESGEFVVCGVANEPEQALRQIAAAAYDIVLMDIVMPGMSGLELIDVIKSRGFSGRFIILTGYAEFEYAKEAMRLGAVDYVLKPIVRKDLMAALERAREDMEKTRNLRDLARSMGVVEALSQPPGDREGKIAELTGFENRTGRYAALSVRHPSSHTAQLDSIRSSSPIPYGNGQTSFFVSLEGGDEPLGALTALPRDWHVGVSRAQTGLEHLRGAWFESQKALYASVLKISDQICAYDRLSLGRKAGLCQSMLQRFNAHAGIDMGLYEEACIGFQAGDIDIECFEVLYARQCSLLREAAYKRRLSVDMLDFGELIRGLYPARDVLCDAAAVLCAKRGPGASGDSQLVQQILSYIQDHYAENLSLTELAVRFHHNASYLSQLIKKVTGRTLTEIKNDYRIGVAQKMLRETELSISEICDASGFNDYFYFNKVFKRITGFTPSTYVRR